MTAAERTQARLQQLAAQLEPLLRRRFLEMAAALSEANAAALADLLATGDVDAAVRWLTTQPSVTAATTALRVAYAESVIRLARAVAADIGKTLRVTVVAPVADPAMIAAIRRWEDEAFRRITEDVREGLRATVAREVARGRGPRQVAIALKNAGALTAYDDGLIASFRLALEEGRVGDALGRTIRDRRFDATLRRGTLSPAQIDKMVAAYRRKLIAWRAETFARTNALAAANEATHASWRAAVDQGHVPLAEVRRYWVVAQDERLCPVCAPMPAAYPRGVGLDESFVVDGARVLSPPAHPNCRCIAFIRRERAGVTPRPAPGA